MAEDSSSALPKLLADVLSADDLTRAAAVAALLPLLESPVPAIRAQVAKALGARPDAHIAEALGAALAREQDGFALGCVMNSLAVAGGAAHVEAIATHLVSKDSRVRAAAVESLEKAGEPKMLPRLLPLLDDPHHRVRVAACRALRAHDRPAVVAVIDKMLDHTDELFVRSAVWVLRYLEDDVALPRLIDRLSAEARDVRTMATESLTFLAKAGSKGAEDALQLSASVLAAQRDARLLAARAGAGSAPAAAPPVRSEPERSELRNSAILDATRTNRRDLLPRFRTMLSAEGDSRVRATLVAALGKLGSAHDSTRLAMLLGDPDPRVRANAVTAIGDLAPARAGELLPPLLADPHHRVRANAVVALKDVRGVDTAPVLREMGRGVGMMPLAAIWACATIRSTETLAIIGELVQSPDPNVAQRARTTLQKLASEPPAARTVLRGDAPAPAPARGGLPAWLAALIIAILLAGVLTVALR